jgi:hypothetical protein
MMGDMSARVAKWAGGALTAAAAGGLGVYFTAVGLDKADKLASVIGAFIGLAGLALAAYGTITDRRPDQPPPAENPPEATSTPGTVHNEIHGGTHHGPAIQGRDIGQVTLGTPPPQPTPPPAPAPGPDAPPAE